MAADLIKKIFRSFDFRNNKILNVKTDMPSTITDAHVANVGYVKGSHLKVLTYALEDYSTLVADLVQYQTGGNIITIEPLGITLQYNGVNWSYFSGTYNIGTTGVWATIDDNTSPNIIKKAGATVKVGNDYYMVQNDLSIVLKYASINSLPASLVEGAIYNLKGVLYFVFGGVAYPYSEKVELKTGVTLNQGTNNIAHTLNSLYISCLCRIYGLENPTYSGYNVFELPVVCVDSTHISIDSSFATLTVDLLLTSKI